MNPVRVDDYSTETGLRVRLTCDTGALQLPADVWHDFLLRCKAGEFDGLATEPKIPYVHWKDGEKYPGQHSEERDEVHHHIAGDRTGSDAQLTSGQSAGPCCKSDEGSHG